MGWNLLRLIAICYPGRTRQDERQENIRREVNKMFGPVERGNIYKPMPSRKSNVVESLKQNRVNDASSKNARHLGSVINVRPADVKHDCTRETITTPVQDSRIMRIRPKAAKGVRGIAASSSSSGVKDGQSWSRYIGATLGSESPCQERAVRSPFSGSRRDRGVRPCLVVNVQKTEQDLALEAWAQRVMDKE